MSDTSQIQPETPLSVELLKSLHGVGKKSAVVIAGVYDSVEKLAGADPKTLAGSLKLPHFVARGAVMGARDLLSDNKKIALGKVPSKPEIVKEDEGERMYVTKSMRLDQYTVKRYRVPVTDATCILCGWDGATTMKLSYDDMSESEQSMAKDLLREHLKLHDNSQLALLRESQMPKSTKPEVTPRPIPAEEASA